MSKNGDPQLSAARERGLEYLCRSACEVVPNARFAVLVVRVDDGLWLFARDANGGSVFPAVDVVEALDAAADKANQEICGALDALEALDGVPTRVQIQKKRGDG